MRRQEVHARMLTTPLRSAAAAAAAAAAVDGVDPSPATRPRASAFA